MHRPGFILQQNPIRNINYQSIMKLHTIWVLLITLLCTQLQAQNIEPRVSEQVELMSILARSANYQEYHMDMAGSYIHDIDSCFTAWSDHPAVSYMKDIRKKHGISYDAVMSMALCLQKGEQQELTLIPEAKKSLGSRWKKVDLTEFLPLLSDFYQKTRFHEFFQAHQSFYERGLKAYRDSVLQHFDVDWYAPFYGKAPQETFSVIIGFCNGGGNYGPSLKENGIPTKVFAIVGYIADKQNRPMYNRGYLSTLVHEFNHSFINYLLDKQKFPQHVSALQDCGSQLISTSQWAMRQQAYGNWQDIISESLVRAAVVCYLKDHNYPSQDVIHEIKQQMQRNFRWMPQLVTLLTSYQKQRDTYPTFEAFYPEIIRFFNHYVDQEEQAIRTAAEN